ncbi:MAG: acetate kinase [Halothece sp. Uz-M2-17]|nr:acetate kinase [Halothece sp. Uz-M2-17]
MKILILNAGSSSQKSSLYYIPDDERSQDVITLLWSGSIDFSQQQGVAKLKVESNGVVWEDQQKTEDRLVVMEALFKMLCEGDTAVLASWQEIDFVGHRVVHGGSQYQQPTWVTEEVKSAIAQLISLAPNHNPSNLQGIEMMEKLLPHAGQVAVFDTAFHGQMPTTSAIYPLPYQWYEGGIRRYGFHGISHDYCAQKTAQLLDQPLSDFKLVTCHLGNGASLAAVKDGHSIDTTMGFTPLEGLMMGTRCGSIDPGIIIHLLREKGLSADEIDQTLNQESGLKGLSGLSGDMRTVTEAMEENERAQLAFATYIHHLCRQIGAMVASLQGLDVLVFTAGVGENSAIVRQAACERLRYLGVEIDPEKNQNHPKNEDIATPDSAVRVLVLHTNEDRAIAQTVWKLAQAKSY